VADKTGELTLFLDPLNRGEASLKIVNSSQTDAIRVPAVTLLDLLAREGLTRVDAIKLDVEGAEDLVLDPFFRDAPASLYPSLFIIANVPERWQSDVVGLLKSKSYRLILETKMNLVFERS
jgi:FkbM family methyltransferase